MANCSCNIAIAADNLVLRYNFMTTMELGNNYICPHELRSTPSSDMVRLPARRDELVTNADMVMHRMVTRNNAFADRVDLAANNPFVPFPSSM